MKILFITNALAQKAGTERILTDKINYLAHLDNYEIYVVTYEQGDHPLAFPLSSAVKKKYDLGLCFWNLHKFNIILRLFIFIRLEFLLWKRLKRVVAQISPDIVDCNLYSINNLGIVEKASGHCRKILENHAIRKYFIKKSKAYNAIQRWLYGLWDYRNNISLKKFDAIVTLTENDKKEWKGFQNVIVIPNILSYYPDGLSLLPKTKRVISVGRMDYNKGYDLLICAWCLVYKKHPDWQLDIYGDGMSRELIKEQIMESHLCDVVHLRGTTSCIYSKYMESDFYVMSSRFEGFGLVLIEAMACGIPCVSFNCPYGPADVIKDGKDGLLVENGNIEQLADKICYLIENEYIRKEMGMNARENVKRFLPENIMPQWQKLFETLIDQKG